jgi:hypothetical protein
MAIDLPRHRIHIEISATIFSSESRFRLTVGHVKKAMLLSHEFSGMNYLMLCRISMVYRKNSKDQRIHPKHNEHNKISQSHS